VTLLCRHGASLELQTNAWSQYGAGTTALNIARKKGHQQCIDALTQAPLLAPFRAAVRRNDSAALSRLLDESKEGPSGPISEDALLSAAALGRPAIIELLLQRGTGLESRDYADRTALHLASGAGHSAAAELLLQRGANIDAQDKDGKTALHAAAAANDIAVLELLQRGANIDAQDQVGGTALIECAGHNQPDMVALLCRRGASLEPKTRAGSRWGENKTALDIARKMGHRQCVDILSLARCAPCPAHSCRGRTGATRAQLVGWAAASSKSGRRTG